MNAMSDKRADFVVMAKPVGSLCNMRCSYCYYLDADNGTAPMTPMTDQVLEAFIKNYIESVAGPVVSFTWHGGEPTLAGIPFFEKAAALEKKYCPEGWEIWNNLQTNGLLIDDAWADFLIQEHFDVGISIDGTGWLHDLHRKNTAGHGTYDQITQAVRRLQAVGIQPDLLCTVSAETARTGAETYRALRELGTGWMQFIPIVERKEDGQLTEESVSPVDYGEFLKDVFAQWFFHDLDTQGVQFFNETAAALAGNAPRLCNMRQTCGDVIVVERDGQIYACDHFVDQKHLLGSVLKDSLSDLVLGEKQRLFGEAKQSNLTEECKSCPYLNACGGGCLKHRFVQSAAGEPGHDYLCVGLRAFFDYAAPLFRRAMTLSREGKTAGQVMEIIAREQRQLWSKVGRNDPCLCGSGKKAKNCCLKRVP